MQFLNCYIPAVEAQKNENIRTLTLHKGQSDGTHDTHTRTQAWLQRVRAKKGERIENVFTAAIYGAVARREKGLYLAYK